MLYRKTDFPHSVKIKSVCNFSNDNEEKPNDCYTAEETFDDLDRKPIAHFGEEYRNLTNARRNRRNTTGLWSFQQL
jgi:hypothetical protein